MNVTRGTSAADRRAVVLGGGVTALSVARSLTDAGVPVYVLDAPDSPARVSRLREAFVEVSREDMQARMLDWLRSCGLEAVVLSGSDEGLELIARHRAELVALGHVPMEADDEVLLAMLDKERTYALGREHGISVPHVRRLRDRADAEAASRELSYPCVLKPVHSHVFARRARSGAKVLTAGSPEELLAVFDRMSTAGVELLVTEVIAGPDDEYVSYYAYMDESGEPLLQLTKRKIRQDPPRFGLGTYHATTHDPDVADAGLRFLRGVGLRGLGNVEFKRDGRDGSLRLIECNARFTMANELIRAAGIDLALFAYNRLLGRPTPPVDSYREDARLLYPLEDVQAFLRYRRNGELSLGRWVGSLLYRQHLPVARIDDPLPALVRGAQKIGRAARSRAGAARASRAHRGPRANGSGASASRRGGPGKMSPRRAAGPPLTVRLSGQLGRLDRRAGRAAELLHSIGPRDTLRRVRQELELRDARVGAGDHYAEIWRDAARALDARVEDLGDGFLEISKGSRRARVHERFTGLDGEVTLRLVRDKAAINRLLRAAGVRLPEQIEIEGEDMREAREFMARCAPPWVLKPAGTSAGQGITTELRTWEDFEAARRRALVDGSRLVLERQVVGDVYRLLVLDGEVIDVIRRLPSRVVGDGHCTVRELIDAENRARLGTSRHPPSLVFIDFECIVTLRAQGLSLDAVPAAGSSVALKRVTNQNGARDNFTVRTPLDPEPVEEARRAAAAAGLRLAGVDIVTTDIARPLAETGGALLEVNGAPGIHYHYSVADPANATPVAVPILRALLA